MHDLITSQEDEVLTELLKDKKFLELNVVLAKFRVAQKEQDIAHRVLVIVENLLGDPSTLNKSLSILGIDERLSPTMPIIEAARKALNTKKASTNTAASQVHSFCIANTMKNPLTTEAS